MTWNSRARPDSESPNSGNDGADISGNAMAEWQDRLANDVVASEAARLMAGDLLARGLYRLANDVVASGVARLRAGDLLARGLFSTPMDSTLLNDDAAALVHFAHSDEGVQLFRRKACSQSDPWRAAGRRARERRRDQGFSLSVWA